MGSADSRLILVQVKIQRAKKHLRDLESELAAFGDTTLSVIGEQVDAHTGHTYREFRTLPVYPFNAIACAGDVTQNLRTALDHLACQLVLAASPPGTEPTRETGFPIAKSADVYEADKIRKLKGVRSEAIKAIDALKPYKGGNEVLWRLHELNNIDKHRTFFTVGPDILLVGDWFDSPWPYWHKATSPHFAGVFDEKVEAVLQLEFNQALTGLQIANANALLPLLHQFVAFVDDLVKSFLPHLSRTP